MTCPVCRSENPVGAKFCKECGSRLAAACPSCGAPTLSDAKFCGECGTVLGGATAPAAESRPHAAQAEPVAERRLVTVLFADLVGFTPFAEERDAEEVREVLTRYFDLARGIIDSYGGIVEKFIGDAVMAVWGAPIAQRGRCRARGPRRARPGRRRAHARPGDPGAGRRPDRRGRRHHRRHQPGDGRGRHRQHRGPAPVGRRAGHGPRRRGDATRRHRCRSRSSPPASRS